jgi:hypothetical protein
LLDQAATQIGVNYAAFGPVDRFAQAPVVNSLAPREPRHPLRLEYPH